MNTPTIYILTGYAGSGKDFFGGLLQDTLSKEFNADVLYTAFARQIKEYIEKGLPESLCNLFPDMSRKDIVDTLKNDRKDIIVYDDGEQSLNMRSFMQRFLGDCIRDIEKDIHAIYELKSIHDKLIQNPELKFICTDNRYENEQNYFIGVNLCSNNKEKISYIQNAISETVNRINLSTVHDKFDFYFPLNDDMDKNHIEFIINLKQSFIESIQNLKGFKPCQTKIDYNTVSHIDFKKLSQEGFAKMGVFNVFREAVPNDYSIDLNNIDELRTVIKNHALLSDIQVDDLFENYKNSGLPLTALKDYGICRTNPTLPSESELSSLNRKGFKINNIGSYGELGVDLNIDRIIDNSERKDCKFYSNKKLRTHLVQN